ncbi:MAG: 50S ribosomal protein L21e [Candidatus Aenigmarchaeota archaeon]|nr:50S ribosomal protein L21e [Candidatus Aenigmarchaeota archaeon]
MRRSRGFRNKTRRTLSTSARKRITITRRLAEIPTGSAVVVKIEPSVQNGMPHPRYQGVRAEVLEKRGAAYVLAIKDKNKPKTLIAYPEHLKVMQN